MLYIMHCVLGQSLHSHVQCLSSARTEGAYLQGLEGGGGLDLESRVKFP